jgi:hypothetical protein
MKRLCLPLLALVVGVLCAACETVGTPAGPAPPATEADGYRTAVAGAGNGTEVSGEMDKTGVADKAGHPGDATPPDGTSPPARTEPATNWHPGEAGVLLTGWVAGDYFDDGRIAGKWVGVENIEDGQVDFPGLPNYDCWGGCYVPVLAETCPVPEIGTLETVRVSGSNLGHGLGINVCVPGGSIVPTGETAEGDPSEFVHFLAIYQEKDLYNRESTILATVVDVLSGSPDYFSDVIRIRDEPSSTWAPAGKSFEEGMTLEVFAWFEEPVAHGRPFAVFGAAFIIWER